MKFGKDVASVDDLIARRKKEKKQKRLNRFMVVFCLVGFTAVCCLGFYCYLK